MHANSKEHASCPVVAIRQFIPLPLPIPSTASRQSPSSEGHPDKVCDYIADSILDAHLEQDTHARVACEVLCKGTNVVLAGEITSVAKVDHEAIAREAIRELGYIGDEEFSADCVRVQQFITQQCPEIAQGVDRDQTANQGAGDQGIMFGFATDETPERMPLPILLAHRLTRQLAEDRKIGRVAWLRPDAKSQVTVSYTDGKPTHVSDIVVSTQHAASIPQSEIAGLRSRRS